MENGASPRGRDRTAGGSRGGFSLLELIVVLAVTVVLTGLLLPALSQVRENLNRVLCSSNMRQIGLGLTMYYRDNRDRLPHSTVLDGKEPQPGELMVAHLGTTPDAWDGIGRLFSEGYCGAPDCYYCPSHRGEHLLEESRDRWFQPERIDAPLYTNFQYAGDVDWAVEHGPRRVRRLQDGDRLVLLTDGWRRRSDFNHRTGMNILRGDGSVRWWEDGENDPLASHLPEGPGGGDYYRIWKLINR